MSRPSAAREEWPWAGVSVQGMRCGRLAVGWGRDGNVGVPALVLESGCPGLSKSGCPGLLRSSSAYLFAVPGNINFPP